MGIMITMDMIDGWIDDVWICMGGFVWLLLFCLAGRWNGMEWNGMEWNGMEWNGMEWNEMEWNEME
jgi:hypothetical protein